MNFDDYSRIDTAFNGQGTTLLTGPGGGGNPNLIALGQMDHFTQQYMWHFIDWNREHYGIYYTPEDFFPDGEPW